MISLAIGTILALGALAFVLYPIFRTSPVAYAVEYAHGSEGGPALSEKQSAIDALREIEFDKATGKLSEEDYANLRARYTSAAVSEMRDFDADTLAAASGGSPEDGDFDAAEALINRFRGKAIPCATCGPRPEPDAIYCSNCGRFLAEACNHCGARISEPGARFCSSCGATLAA